MRNSASLRYQLLAVDLDGTLLNSRSEVSSENVRAISRAKDAGLRVVICTGRGHAECKHIAQDIGQTDPMVVAGGAILAEAISGKTIRRFPMGLALVRDLVSTLGSHGHAALVLKDPCGVRDSGVHGPHAPENGDAHEYLVVSPRGVEGIDPVTRWWFKEHKLAVRVVDSLEKDLHPEHTVRVGVCGTRGETTHAALELQHQFADRITLHHFQACAPGEAPRESDDQIVIVEAFDKSVNKWACVQWLAKHEGIDERRICAIGNDINDLPMLRYAGLGIAVDNAIPEARAIAARATLSNDAHGVAHAIDQILSGSW